MSNNASPTRPGAARSPQPVPLILTLALDEAAQARFEALRRAHFPPARNRVPAHATLFHRLPGEQAEAVEATLAALCRDAAPCPVEVEGLRFLGGGVAFVLRSPPLAALRDRLRAAWLPWLTPQDRQPWRPHVTVQNKAAPEAARRLHGELSRGFAPFVATATGLRLWRYLGGPWEAARGFPFGADPC